MFRNYVLTSKLSPDENPQMDWRWPLWLELYPKVRKCTNAEEAAEIVVRATRERLGLPKPGVTPFGILGSWWHGTADSAAYPKTLVAALRSAGVAAKLDDTGQAQFWTGKEWKLVMERDRPFDVRGF